MTLIKGLGEPQAAYEARRRRVGDALAVQVAVGLLKERDPDSALVVLLAQAADVPAAPQPRYVSPVAARSLLRVVHGYEAAR